MTLGDPFGLLGFSDSCYGPISQLFLKLTFSRMVSFPCLEEYLQIFLFLPFSYEIIQKCN